MLFVFFEAESKAVDTSDVTDLNVSQQKVVLN